MSDIIFKDVSLTKRAPAWKFFYSNEDKKLAKCQVDNCSKVINWKNGLSGLSNHTQLYRFFKSIKPSSIDPDRGFSAMGYFCTKIQSRMGNDVLYAITCIYATIL
jgi:hypothetical protein